MIGQEISHYRVVEKIGSGGMGTVYKARDTKLDRFVALKFLPHHLSEAREERQRFVQEAQTASALDHPNICTIYEIDRTARGELFIAMAFYEGQSLKDLLQNGPLDVEMALRVAIELASGLERVHETGIIHRDIKPANILITDRQDIKLVDFGLAKLSQQSDLTDPGTKLGTTAYMSPEQAQGDEVDCRSDIWALGAVLYEMLTGERPFRGEHSLAIIYSIINEAQPNITELATEISPELAGIVSKMLQKDPKKRYQTMGDCLSDLRGVRDGRVSISASAEAITDDKSAVSIAVLPFADLSSKRDQEYFCDGLSEELIDTLATIKEWRVLSRTSAFSYKGREEDIREIGKQLRVSHVLEGSVRKSGNRVRIRVQLTNVADGFHLWSEKYDRELDDIFAIQDDIARSIVANLQKELVAKKAGVVKRYTDNIEAYNLYLQARFHLNKRTESGLTKAIELCEHALTLDESYALAHACLADALILKGFQGFQPPGEVIPGAKSSVEKALALDDSLAEAHTSLACILAVFDRDWSRSEAEFERALELNPNSATAHYWYAIWYLLPQAHFSKALDEIKRAKELDPLSLVLNSGIGWQYYFAGNYQLAIGALKRTLELDSGFVFALDTLGQVYEQLGKFKYAIPELEKAVALSNRRSLSLGALGHAYGLAGEATRAEAILDELSSAADKRYISQYDLALVNLGLGDHQAAITCLEKAYDTHNGWLNFLNVDPRMEPLRSHPKVRELLNMLGLSG